MSNEHPTPRLSLNVERVFASNLRRRRPVPGYDVQEAASTPGEVTPGIADAQVLTQRCVTTWECPACGTRWARLGIHAGTLTTCRAPGCGEKFFLRRF